MREKSALYDCYGRGRQTAHLVSKGLEFAGRAGIQVHELVSIHKQGCLFALILILEGSESSALHLQNTGQVSYVALKSQEPSPDLAAARTTDTNSSRIQ